MTGEAGIAGQTPTDPPTQGKTDIPPTPVTLAVPLNVWGGPSFAVNGLFAGGGGRGGVSGWGCWSRGLLRRSWGRVRFVTRNRVRGVP